MTYGQWEPHLPIDPLWRRAAARWRPTTAQNRHGGPQGPGEFSSTALAEACGVTRRTVSRWRHRGLTWDKADKAACALGLHPASVWGGDWWAVVPWEDVA